MSACRWCFTINNWSPEDLAGALAMPDVRYLVVAEEVGESGTPHLQGFVIFSKVRRLAAVAKLLPRSHLEQARGTNQQASDYCKKPETDPSKIHVIGELPKERGQAGGDETKRRFAEAFDLAKEGRLDEICPVLRTKYYGTYKRIKCEYQPTPADHAELISEWRWGPTGCGKSLSVRTEHPDLYRKGRNKWWDGYRDQDVVVVEDLDPSHEWMASLLKDWADHQPFQAESKGSCVEINPRLIIVTSQYPIESIFKDPESVSALNRRYKQIYMGPVSESAPTCSRAPTYHPAPNFPFSDFSK